jgi:hypothetical protein
MSIGANISAIAFGAILSFATHVNTPGFDIPAIGAIIMVVGVAGLIMQLASLSRQRQLTAFGALRSRRRVVVRPSNLPPTSAPVLDDPDRDGGF